MKIKALLLVFVIATAPRFLSDLEAANIFAQEAGPSEVLPSPLQPAATISAEELEKIENLGIPLEVEFRKIGESEPFPLERSLFSLQIFGVKILPLILALITMAGLGFAINRITVSFTQKKFSKKEANVENEKNTTRRKRGRPPKKSGRKDAPKRPRGRPRKTLET